MSVLFIEDTTIENNHVYVTALVEDMQLVALAHRDSPEEWVPGLCSTSFATMMRTYSPIKKVKS
jgi:hypothetical protein